MTRVPKSDLQQQQLLLGKLKTSEHRGLSARGRKKLKGHKTLNSKMRIRIRINKN